MSGPGKYLYCVIPCAEERLFAELVPIEGTESTVHTIPSDGLAAVVSDTATTRFETTRANMMAHQRVLEMLLKEFTLLPVRFGTVAASPSPSDEVQRLLIRRREEFKGLLQEMEGRVEVGLKAFWREEQAIYQELLAENPALRRTRDSLRGQPGLAAYQAKIRLGEQVEKALSRKRTSEAALLLDPLQRIACRTVENPVLTDGMILNAAFLVTKGREGEFDLAVAKIDEQVSHRVALKYVGPVPPYNFVNITVNWEEL